MKSNIERYKDDLRNLIIEGKKIYNKMENNESLGQLRQDFEIWYSESSSIIKILLPDRISDFTKMYYDDKSKNGLMKYLQYTDEFTVWNDSEPVNTAKSVFDSQLGILKSCERRFESSLFDIKQLLQADIFKSELDAARELNKKGFTRGAGAIAGVVLEGHLTQVCKNHDISTKKKPSINDLNQLLKNNGVIEIQDWRFIQRLGDLRNLCDHKMQIDPKKEDVEELIKGVDKISKTLF